MYMELTVCSPCIDSKRMVVFLKRVDMVILESFDIRIYATYAYVIKVRDRFLLRQIFTVEEFA